MLTGFVVALVWPHIYNEQATGVHVYNLPLAFVAALIVNLLASLALPDKPEPRGFPVALAHDQAE
jgi:hypothetical protein